MACYPFVLLIVGLKQYGVSGTIKNLVESCKNVDNLDSYFPPPIPKYITNVFPNYHHDIMQSEKHNRDIKYGKEHFFMIKDDLKKYIKEISNNDIEGEMSKKLDDDIKLDTPTPLSWSRAKLKKHLEKKYLEDNVNDIKKTNTNHDNNKQYLRIRNKSISIPAIDDMRTLIRNIRKKTPLVAISNKLLKKIMNIKDHHIKTNPFFANLSPGTPLSGKKKLFLGVPTNHLVKMILDTFQINGDSGASQPFFKILIDAAMNFLGLGGKKKEAIPQKKEIKDEFGDFFSNLFG